MLLARMAKQRDTAQGTVEAQCGALYRKADVTGRLQWLILFPDNLMAETSVPARTVLRPGYPPRT